MPTPICSSLQNATNQTHQGAFIALLLWECEILQDFRVPKQAPINAFLLCLQNQLIVNISINLKLHRKGTAKFVNLQILSRKSFEGEK